MQNYIQQPYRFNPNMPYQQAGYKALPVASEAEMNTYTVDFNGTPTYFHNQTSNEIYVKQFDIKTGLTTSQKFIKADIAGHELSEGKSELGINTLEEKFNALNDRLNGFEEILNEIKEKGVKK